MHLNNFKYPSSDFTNILHTGEKIHLILSRKDYIMHCKHNPLPSIKDFGKIKYCAGYKYYSLLERDIECDDIIQVHITSINNPNLAIKLNLVNQEDSTLSCKYSHFTWGPDDESILYCAYFPQKKSHHLVINYFDDREPTILDQYPLCMIDNIPFDMCPVTKRIFIRTRSVLTNTDDSVVPIEYESNNINLRRIRKNTLKNEKDFISLVSGRIVCVDLITFKEIYVTPTEPIRSFTTSATGRYFMYRKYIDYPNNDYYYSFGTDTILVNLEEGTHRTIFTKHHEIVSDSPDEVVTLPRNIIFMNINKKDCIMYVESYGEGDHIYKYNIESNADLKNAELIMTTKMHISNIQIDTYDRLWVTEESNRTGNTIVSCIEKDIYEIFKYNRNSINECIGKLITISDHNYRSRIYCPDKDSILIKSFKSIDDIRPTISLTTVLGKRDNRIIWESSSDTFQIPRKIFVDRSLNLIYTSETNISSVVFYKTILDVNGIIYNSEKIADHHFVYRSLGLRKKESIVYVRSDGVKLTATISFPPDYETGSRQIVVHAYPNENYEKDVGFIKSSCNEFKTINWISPEIWLSKGYIVVEPDMPIIKDHGGNNTFIEQIVMNAYALVDMLINRGWSDGHHIKLIGYSYGAFMVANLLANTNLFCAGIAMSGAYNRTLTPFGFQNENRTLWQAKDMYLNISPVMCADKIKVPLLLVHGEDDDNPGTDVRQSINMYDAIRVNGGVTKLVILPHEGHIYHFKENIMHMLATQEEWFAKY